MQAETKRILAEEALMDFAIAWAVEHRDAESHEAIKFAEWYAVAYPDGDKSVREAFDFWEANLKFAS